MLWWICLIKKLSIHLNFLSNFWVIIRRFVHNLFHVLDSTFCFYFVFALLVISNACHIFFFEISNFLKIRENWIIFCYFWKISMFFFYKWKQTLKVLEEQTFLEISSFYKRKISYFIKIFKKSWIFIMFDIEWISCLIISKKK